MSEQWRTKDWWVSEYNYAEEVRGRFQLPKKVIFHDATLRDGEQMPGVVFRKEEKIAIAKKLDEIGVQRIEAGMPAVSEEDFEAMTAICKLGLKAEIFSFSRAHTGDIDKAIACGVDGVVLEVPSGLPRLLYQFDWTEDEVIERTIKAIKYAKEKGLKVVFFPYDTTRAQWPFLSRFLTEVEKNAAPDAIAVIDTTGVALPDAIFYLVKKIKTIVKTPIEVHTHNDLGLGVATSLAAVQAGAECVHVCVNGLGERCGNTALEEAAVAIRSLLDIDTGIQYDKLYELSKFVEELSRVKLAINKPLVGDVPFTREIGLGMDVIKKEPTAILPIRPEFMGRSFRLVLGKKSGKPSIRMKLDALGVDATEEQVEELLKKVKLLSIEEKRYLTDEEFEVLMKDVIK